MSHPNSTAALATITADGRRLNRSQQIVAVLKRMGRGTDREIMHALGFTDLNSVRPRINELLDSGEVQHCANERDPITGMRVRVVRPLPVVPTQTELF